MVYKAPAARKKVLGPDYSDTITTGDDIELVLDNQGQYDKALVLYQRALAVLEVTRRGDEVRLTTVCKIRQGSGR